MCTCVVMHVHACVDNIHIVIPNCRVHHSCIEKILVLNDSNKSLTFILPTLIFLY